MFVRKLERIVYTRQRDAIWNGRRPSLSGQRGGGRDMNAGGGMRALIKLVPQILTVSPPPEGSEATLERLNVRIMIQRRPSATLQVKVITVKRSTYVTGAWTFYIRYSPRTFLVGSS